MNVAAKITSLTGPNKIFVGNNVYKITTSYTTIRISGNSDKKNSRMEIY
jgi:hypothetical protein